MGMLVPALSARARQDAAPADAPASARQADPSGAASVHVTTTATVAAVDPANRLVVLQTADGDMIPVKCGKSVTRLDQIKPGDEVKAVAMGRVAVFVGKDAPPDGGDGAERIVMRTTQDGKPGLIIVDTTQSKEKVESVDAAGKTITLQGDDGKPMKIGVGPDVDLSGIEKGAEVTVRSTGGLALSVQRPQEGAQPAGAAIATETRTATVTAVDPEKRVVTLKNPEGKVAMVTLGKQAINFDQIKPGDQVRATMAEEVAVSIDKSGAPSTAEERRVIASAPKGARPGVIIADSKQVSAKIESIDAEQRTITLAEPGGEKPRKIKVGRQVDLTQFKRGDEVTARVTEAMAIVVEKPQQP
jgi:hypothetical protein